ncbi:TetR/AcrR family transcriptional regulator [Mycobacterium sp. BMJ-28]
MSTPSRSRGRPPIPLERIIDAATAILDEHGADALSMRTLAQKLDSGTATLYRHFPSRNHLLARVVDAAIGEVDIAADDLHDLSWQRTCETVAQRMFDVLGQHPHIALVMIDRIPVGPNMLALRERALAQLLASGFPPRLALQAWATLARFVLGFGSQFGPDGGTPEMPAAWVTVDPAQFPASVAVSKYAPVPLESEFTFGLELLIAGLERRLNRH